MSLLSNPSQLKAPDSGPLVDGYGRVHTYLRVSVTDRCNYRCQYCMPAEGLKWLHKSRLLSFEEIVRIVGVFASMGVSKVRITGGEPTVRSDLEVLIQGITGVEGIDDISMTTNGHGFVNRAAGLFKAGLRRVNFSLDTLDASEFNRITRGGNLEKVLDGIHEAIEVGFSPVKINCVVVGGVNDHQVLPILEYFGGVDTEVVVRFIEKMPFTGNVDEEVCVPVATLRERIEAQYRILPFTENLGGGPAVYWKVPDLGVTVGFISPITEHFCDTCNRLRLMANGELRTCLSKEPTPNLRDQLRSGLTDEALEQLLRKMVWMKTAGHEAHLSGELHKPFEGTMTQIGG